MRLSDAKRGQRELKKAKPTAQAVRRELLDIAARNSGRVDWATVLADVGARFAVTNWLTQVRGPLQALINEGQLTRSADLQVEVYHAAESPRNAIEAPVTDLASAKHYINGLIAAHLFFHLEDDPADVVKVDPNNHRVGNPLFTAEEVKILRKRVANLYKQNWGVDKCPISYALKRMKMNDVSLRFRIVQKHTDNATGERSYVLRTRYGDDMDATGQEFDALLADGRISTRSTES